MDIAKSLLIPVKKYSSRGGRFSWPRRALLASPRTADLLPLRQLAGDLKSAGVTAIVEQAAALPTAVSIVRDNAIAGGESYRLAISPAGVEIRTCTDAGAYYAVQTLRELVTLAGKSLPCCVIDDEPDFPRRGVYHDVSRGKVPKLATLKDLVERLARWKINELQLYIENVFTFRRHPAIGRGFDPLTPEDILALQEHCKCHHVRLVGSLASFGHLEKVLALPEYAHLGEYTDRPCSTLCPTDGGAIRLLGELYEEFAPLFEAVDFNICGDETWELGKGRSKRRARQIGQGRLYTEFLLKVRQLCLRHGKRMNMWADIVLQHPEVLGDWPKDVVMLNWDYAPAGVLIPRTREITDRGIACMVCPGTNAWGSHGCRLRMGQKNIHDFAAEGLARGAEGLLNTDWGDCGHRNVLAVSLANFAYGGACSWNLAGVADRGFVERFCRHSLGNVGRRGAAALAASIETLGSIEETMGWPHANSLPTCWVLFAPLNTLKADPSLPFDNDAEQCAKLEAHAANIENLRWPDPSQADDLFDADTFAEFALAAQLDAFACRWLITVKHHVAGRTPPRLREVRQAARDLAGPVKTTWLRRNRPSRLGEVLDTLKALARK